MHRALIVGTVAVWLLGTGIVVGYGLNSWIGDDDIGDPRSTTIKQLVPRAPGAAGDTQIALLTAAEAGDYEALRPLIPETGFSYTFGGPVEGGPIAYWQDLERTTGERPLETLAAILKMPYVLSRGIYAWPFAYTATSPSDLSEHERKLLVPLGALERLFVPGTGYLGWRTGIAPDGTWTFFVAGD